MSVNHSGTQRQGILLTSSIPVFSSSSLVLPATAALHNQEQDSVEDFINRLDKNESKQ